MISCGFDNVHAPFCHSWYLKWLIPQCHVHLLQLNICQNVSPCYIWNRWSEQLLLHHYRQCLKPPTTQGTQLQFCNQLNAHNHKHLQHRLWPMLPMKQELIPLNNLTTGETKQYIIIHINRYIYTYINQLVLKWLIG